MALLNSTQWGADISLNSSCEAVSQLPIPNQGTSIIFIALLKSPFFDTMWTVGEDLPANYLVSRSNDLVMNGTLNPHLLGSGGNGGSGGVRFIMYWEPWFTPHNMNWGMAEAIPLVGRYSSIGLLQNTSKSIANRNVVKQHALWFAMMGVTAIGIDWTNNLWSVATWADRGVYAQELINATHETLLVYADLREAGYPVPEFVLLLGLDNGPQATIAALNGEVEWVTENILDNSRLSSLFIRDLAGGLPLLVLFDGGNIHAKLPPLNSTRFTLRYMSSQFQSNFLNIQGFYSWMDGSIKPLPTPNPANASLFEALTITNAFFAGGGWLAPDARSTANGATLLEEAWQAVQYRPQLLFLCQWNEYAGQSSPSAVYVDIYNATFGNDMEPTSMTACGLAARPNNAYCGGWGFRYINILRGIRHILNHDGRQNSESLLVVIQTPVPWKGAISASNPLPVTFVTLGHCTNLASFHLWFGLEQKETAAVVNATSTGEGKYSADIPSSIISQQGSGWHALHVAARKSNGDACRASVHLAYDELSVEKDAVTVDTVHLEIA